MTPSIISVGGLLGNFAIFTFGLSVMGIALWQNYQARFNQYLAILMGLIAAWSIPNGLAFVGSQLEIDGEVLIKISTTLYALVMLALLYFLTEFEQDHYQRMIAWIRGAAWVGILGMILLTWANVMWERVSTETDGSYRGHLSELGIAVSLAGLVGFGIIGYQLRESAIVKRPELLISTSPMLVIILPVIVSVPINQIIVNFAVLLGTILITRVALHDRLFNPLIQLYEELKVKNTELEKANRLKNEFLANMSHELRTPMNSIIGYTDLVIGGAYGAVNDKQLNRLEKINSNGKRLLNLINNVLDLNKLNAERLELHPIRIAPAALIDDILVTLQPIATQKNLTVTRNYQELPSMFADETRARQIILNVLANAIKFTAAGGVTIGGYLDAIRNHVILTVTDTGIGISMDDADKIFKAFEGLSDKISREDTHQDGLGLGLAISKRLAELHGGDIWFESTYQKGSIFYVRLPAATDTTRHILNDPTNAPELPVILVIDNDLETIEVLQDYLHQEGFRVYGALTGREGVLRAQELRPKAIILEVAIPGVDGWRTIELLKTDEKLKAIPVILTSINEYSSGLVHQAGATDFIIKPLGKRVLLQTVQKATMSTASTSTQP